MSTNKPEEMSLVQQALGSQWQQLPPALKAHYQATQEIHIENGWLDVSFPSWMQIPLKLLRLFNALLDKRGERIPTIVKRRMQGQIQYWQRTLDYPDKKRFFKSFLMHERDNQLIEYTNGFLGLRMQVSVQNGQMHYRSKGYVLKLFAIKVTLPEWLVLGHAFIEESALDDQRFQMNFWLKHPLLGEIFRYKGEFSVQKAATNS